MEEPSSHCNPMCVNLPVLVDNFHIKKKGLYEKFKFNEELIFFKISILKGAE